LAVQPGGDYLVAWDHDDYSQESLFYNYFTPAGKPANPWQSLMVSPEDFPELEAVTATPKGFDLLWHVPYDTTPTAFYRGHLDLNGVPDGEPVRLGGTDTDWVWNVRGNGFVAGWALPKVHGIAARRLTSSGQRTGPEMRLNSRPVDAPAPVVLAVADGGFVAVWFGTVPGRKATPVLRARRFSPAGKPLGPDFDVNTIPTGVGGRSPVPPVLDSQFKVAAAPGGGFAVAWMLDSTLYLRFFNALGKALGPQVPAATEENGGYPLSMAFDDTGNLMLLWVQDPEGMDTNLQLQLFGPHGAPLGPPEDVNSVASGIYQVPWLGNVAWAGDSWLVAWLAGAPDEDGSYVFVRRFAAK
jgi:hypothetical protein